MILKQTTTYTRTFLMVDSTDHLTGKTGLTVAVSLSKAGAAFAAAAGTVAEIANGWYSVALTTADTGTLGDLAFHCTSAGADPTDFADQVTVDLPGGSVSSVTGAVASVTGNVGGNVVGSVASVTADVGITQAGADKVWSTTVRAITDKAGFALSAAGVQAVWDALTSALTTVGSIGKRLADDIDAAISSRSTYAGADTAGTTTLLGRLTATRATNLDDLDATISSRSTFAGGAVASVTGDVGGNVVGSVASVVGVVAADIKRLNGTTLNGNGSTTPWGP